MNAGEKMDAGMDKLKGKAKQAAGHVTDNEKLVAEGKVDEMKGNVKDSAEKAKDTMKDVFDK